MERHSQKPLQDYIYTVKLTRNSTYIAFAFKISSSFWNHPTQKIILSFKKHLGFPSLPKQKHTYTKLRNKRILHLFQGTTWDVPDHDLRKFVLQLKDKQSLRECWIIEIIGSKHECFLYVLRTITLK